MAAKTQVIARVDNMLATLFVKAAKTIQKKNSGEQYVIHLLVL